MNQRRLYCCYSIPQRDFLSLKGIKYEILALSPNTKTTMWVYIKNEKLDKYLNEWSQGNK